MRFLLIEEDESASSLLASKLKESFNCQVDQVRQSQKSFRLLKTEVPYDFIIYDYEAPTCNGIQFLHF